MTQLRTSRRRFLAGLGASAAGIPATFAIAQDREKVTFGTSWVALVANTANSTNAPLAAIPGP